MNTKRGAAGANTSNTPRGMNSKGPGVKRARPAAEHPPVEAPDGARLVVTSRKNRNDVMEYALTRATADAGFAGYAGDESVYPHGRRNPDGVGGCDGVGDGQGAEGEANPANPANPAVESWEA